MKSLNAFSVPRASCIAYAADAGALGSLRNDRLLSWTIADVNINFRYDVKYDPLFDTPQYVPTGGTITLGLENAPTASFLDAEYLGELRVNLGLSGQAPMHQIRLFGCEKTGMGLVSAPAGGDAWSVRGVVSYDFAKVNTGTVTLTLDNKSRGWYF
jgi:hypothetical protein